MGSGYPRQPVIRDAMAQSIILFDGVCNLCNQSVQFVLKHDSHSRFLFAPLQSPFGQSVLVAFGKPEGQFNSVVVLKNKRLFEKSDAALEIARDLSGLWPLLYGFRWVPRFLRDGLYDWVAQNRYRWFGQREECMIPTANTRQRFIQDTIWIAE